MASAPTCRIRGGASLSLVVSSVFSLGGCGNATNFNHIWGREDGAGDTLLIEGQAAYDSGNFAKAESLVQQLIARNPDNEDAAILLGFTHLSQGSIDPFSIARQLVAQSTANTQAKASGQTTGTKATLRGDGSIEAAMALLRGEGLGSLGATSSGTAPATATTAQDAATAAATNAAGILSGLAGLVQMSDSERQMLYKHQFGAGDNLSLTNQPTEPELFINDRALEVPATVNDDLRRQISALHYINSAIKDVCHLVDSEVKVAANPRDNDGCTQTVFPRYNVEKAHFLWILAHLAEAMVFEPVILYTPPGSTLPSLTTVSSVISTKSVSSLAEIQTLTRDVVEVKNAVTSVFNAGDSQSMLVATLQDLNAVTLGFGRLAGLPTSVQDSLTSAFNSITALGKELGSATSTANNSNGFKAQMTQALSKSVGSKIQAAAQQNATSANPATTDQIKQMCNAFSQLTAGEPPSQIAAAKPKACL